MDEQFLFADFFAGAGGLSQGLADAGFAPMYAFDHDPDACETYRRNIGSHVFSADARLLNAEQVSKDASVKIGELALVAGGPPCQGLSMQGKGAPQDPRNDLLVQFAELATALKPTFIMIENVPGLLGSRGKTYLTEVLSIFSRNGYDYDAEVLDAADYGVPQQRLRAFVVAWRSDRVKAFNFPAPTNQRGSWATVRSAIEDLPEPRLDFT